MPRRRKLTEAESEFLEIGEEPIHVLTTGRLGRNEVQELHVWYVGDTTLVEGHGQLIQNIWAFDEILDPQEVMDEFESSRW